MTTATIISVLVGALLIVWVVAVVVYGLVLYLSERQMLRLMRGYAERFPKRCFFCSYYRNVLMEPPPEHDCREWTADPGEDDDLS